jgi:phosphatidylserine/phosphatidylglycerophosphate/cardiolipin synthase-like enzyme
MTEIARSQNTVVVRVLLGAPVGISVRAEQVRNAMVRDARAIQGSKLKLYVMAYRQGDISWNHAKIIANDTTAIVGGHNLWTTDYLLKHLVHDVSMKVDGPAATASHQYLDRIWARLCPIDRPASYDAQRFPTDYHGCNPFPNAPKAPGSGEVPVLAVGNYASLLPEETS